MKIRVKRASDGRIERLNLPEGPLRVVEGVARNAIRLEKDLSLIFDLNGFYLGYGFTAHDPYELAAEAVARIEAGRESS